MRQFVIIAAGLAVSLLATPAKAQWTLNGVTVICPWAEETQPGVAIAPVYMWISASPQGEQRLTDALSEVSQGAEISGYIRVAGALQRERLQYLPIAAGQTLELAPGGYHVLLTGLNTQLVRGGTFGMWLNFDPAGGLEVEVQVVSVGGRPSCAPGGAPIRDVPVRPPRWVPRGSF
jgi:copper(I)-binding protein